MVGSQKASVDLCKEMLKKYDGVASKNVYEIVTVEESWICAYEPETKQQTTGWVIEPEPKSTKVVFEGPVSSCFVSGSYAQIRDSLPMTIL